MEKEDIFVGGIPQYDDYFKKECLSREVFFNRIGVDPRKKLIVYAPMGRAYSNSDWDIIDLLYAMKSNGEFGEDTELLVRFKPNDFIEEEELKKRPWLIYDYPGKRFSTSRGVDWDMNSRDLEHLKNTLKHMSLLICYASSISVDAAVFNKPVINLNFEVRPKEFILKSPTFYYEMTHYKEALTTGGITLVGSKEELASSVRAYLDNPSLNHEKRSRLVSEQYKFTDGMSGKRIGEFVLHQLQ
jgi:CDP-glycerol glycerophosphotransferase (TagB/SpsB family)